MKSKRFSQLLLPLFVYSFKLFLLFFVIFLFCPLTSSLADTPHFIEIGGTVSVPPGMTAIRDTSVLVGLINEGGFQYRLVTIPKDSTSIEFYFSVVKNSNKEYTIKYIYSGSDFVSVGYYSLAGTTWKLSDATTLLDNEDHLHANITLLGGKKISGTFTLPVGQIADPDNIQVEIQTHDINGSNTGGSCTITLNKGTSSGDYTLTVPDNGSASWLIHYSYNYHGALRKGFFSENGTTLDIEKATPLSGGIDHSDINMVAYYSPWILFVPAIVSHSAAPPAS